MHSTPHFSHAQLSLKHNEGLIEYPWLQCFAHSHLSEATTLFQRGQLPENDGNPHQTYMPLCWKAAAELLNSTEAQFKSYLHEDAAPLPMLVTVFQNCPSAFLSYENLQTLSSLPHHCCAQPNNLPGKGTLWGQTPSERPSHVSPVIKMRNPHMPVTACQLVALLPWDIWSYKGVQAIQALHKQFLAVYCSKLPR